MIRKAFFLAVALLLPALSQAQVKLLRHPTYSKGKVAFSYLGDIWIANENGSDVQRLTDNQARDVFPRFSPDGNWIAFSSNREGNYDVYVIPATGGKPRQLTFHSADDNVVGWTPGRQEASSSPRLRGNGVVSHRRHALGDSRRRRHRAARQYRLGRLGQLFSRRHQAGLHPPPQRLVAQALSRQLCGRPLGGWTWPRKKFTKLGDEDYKGNCLWPMYGRDGDIYFVSNAAAQREGIKSGSPEVMKSVNNIWKISDKGGKPVQVTNHADGNLFFPSISADGKTIVYEDNFGLWKLDTATGKSSEIRIDIKSDFKENNTELVTITNEAEGFHLSPSNQRAAIVGARRDLHHRHRPRRNRSASPRRPGRSRTRAGRPTASGSPSSPTAPAAKRSTSPTNSAKPSRNSPTPIATRTPSCGPPIPSPSCGPAPITSCARVDIDSGKDEIVARAMPATSATRNSRPTASGISYSKPDKLLRARTCG